jgi:asparagine synthase (glutamine-hydrolysing)
MVEYLSKLEKLIRAGVEESCRVPRVGVIYSSGVDSALVAQLASEYADVTAYNVSVGESPDYKYAKKAHSDGPPYNIDFIKLSQDDVEALIPEILCAWDDASPLTFGVGIPFWAAARAAKADGQKILLCGQGGDELFGGYWRYLECMTSKGADAVIEWMEKDFKNAYADNLNRDIAMAQQHGLQLLFPLLHPPLTDFVRHSLPFEYKIRENAKDILCDTVDGREYARKYALKKAAIQMGVPEYLAVRLKKAAQYGSGTQKTLDKIARSKGYKKLAKDASKKSHLQMYLEDVKKAKA